MRRSPWCELARSLSAGAPIAASAGRVLALAGAGAPHPDIKALADEQGAIILSLGEADDTMRDAVQLASAFLDQTPEDFCLLSYCRPGQALAQALAEGEDCEAAIREWIDDARETLAFLDAYPMRTALVHGEAALAHLDELNSHLAVYAPGIVPASREKSAPRPALHALFLEAGEQIADRFEEADTLFEALDASALIGSHKAPTADIDSLLQCAEAISDQRTALQTTQAELSAAQARARTLQDALDEKEADLSATQAELSATQADLSAAQADLSAAHARTRALQDALDEKEAGLAAVKISSRQQADALRQKIERERARTREAREIIAQMEASLVWRTGDKVRKIADPVRRITSGRGIRQSDIEKIRASDFFDAEWYRKHYPDIAEAGVDPAEHYLRSGAREGRAAGPRFCSTAYLKNNPDVARAKVNPLLHYIEAGQAEQRLIYPPRLTKE